MDPRFGPLRTALDQFVAASRPLATTPAHLATHPDAHQGRLRSVVSLSIAKGDTPPSADDPVSLRGWRITRLASAHERILHAQAVPAAQAAAERCVAAILAIAPILAHTAFYLEEDVAMDGQATWSFGINASAPQACAPHPHAMLEKACALLGRLADRPAGTRCFRITTSGGAQHDVHAAGPEDALALWYVLMANRTYHAPTGLCEVYDLPALTARLPDWRMD